MPQLDIETLKRIMAQRVAPTPALNQPSAPVAAPQQPPPVDAHPAPNPYAAQQAQIQARISGIDNPPREGLGQQMLSSVARGLAYRTMPGGVNAGYAQEDARKQAMRQQLVQQAQQLFSRQQAERGAALDERQQTNTEAYQNASLEETRRARTSEERRQDLAEKAASAKAKEPREVSPNATLVPSDQPLPYTAPGAPKTEARVPVADRVLEDWLSKNPGKGPAEYDAEKAGRSNAAGQGARTDARSDRSYTYHSTALDKIGGPIADSLQRVSRLNDTLAQGTPMADAVTAPELMVVMAGGAGSGVRITQGEINNVLGGQSKWEQAKAALAQWSTNPEEANRILAPMRGQMMKLVKVVHDKAVKKEAVIQDARQRLVDADTPQEHKQIYADAQKALTAIDGGEGSGSAAAPTARPRAVDSKGNAVEYDGAAWVPVKQ